MNLVRQCPPGQRLRGIHSYHCSEVNGVPPVAFWHPSDVLQVAPDNNIKVYYAATCKGWGASSTILKSGGRPRQWNLVYRQSLIVQETVTSICVTVTIGLLS